MIKEKDRVVYLPPKNVVDTESFQRRLAMTLRNLPEPKSRRALRVEVQMCITAFKGKIILSCGYQYDRWNLDSVMGHESGRQISMILEMKGGEPRYKPSSLTYPRLLLCIVTWLFAGHIWQSI